MTISSVTKDEGYLVIVEDAITKRRSIVYEDAVVSVPPTDYTEVGNIYVNSSGNLVVNYNDSSFEIEAGATGDLTGAEIVTLLEALTAGSRLSHTKLDDVGENDHHTKFTTTEHSAIGDGAPHHTKYTNVEAIAAAKTDAALLIPSGTIVMWHGTIANIPTGWVLCDGDNGTPNLLARFVQGVATAATNPGATGGATAKATGGHVHTQPTHTHTVDVWACDKTGSILSEGAASRQRLLDFIGNPDWIAEVSAEITSKGKRETTAAEGNQNTGSETDGIVDIRPLYYDIAFIMKT